MSGFIRPELRAQLWRWREAIAAAAVVAFGLWIALNPGPILRGFGWLVAGAGLVVFVLALRRARFARTGEGPGIVTLDEGRIAYMGPFYGGVVALDDLTGLALRRARDGRQYWLLSHAEGALVIPVEARGADVLFDAFTALEGLAMGPVLSALEDRTPGTVTLWSRAARPALTR